MTDDEKLEVAQLQTVLGNKVAYSLRAAASEVLGTDTEKFSNYFQIHGGVLDEEPAIIAVETVTGKDYKVPIIYTILQEESDEPYYARLRELAEIALPYIPAEELTIPKDEWPEPRVWEEVKTS